MEVELCVELKNTHFKHAEYELTGINIPENAVRERFPNN